jgi:chromosome segregation ATPase
MQDSINAIRWIARNLKGLGELETLLEQVDSLDAYKAELEKGIADSAVKALELDTEINTKIDHLAFIKAETDERVEKARVQAEKFVEAGKAEVDTYKAQVTEACEAEIAEAKATAVDFANRSVLLEDTIDSLNKEIMDLEDRRSCVLQSMKQLKEAL